MIGQIVSHYKIIEELGRGGMCVVYKAQDTKLDRFVALKFLPLHLSQADEEKKRFIHEAKTASALDHPNICTIHEVNETEEGQMFIAMACYEGESLRERLERGPLEVEEAINIAIQIAGGLEKAHAKKIVHRDIKPANIILTDDGQVKIVDFGLAKLVGRSMLTKAGTALGTVAYMSPEQTQGTDVDHRTDIWALGVLLYEMLTGKRPFQGDYEQAVVYSILNEGPDPLTKFNASIPNSLEQVVGKALEKNRDKRYQSITELLDDLKSISEGIVPEAIKTRVRKADLQKRRKLILYIVSAVLIVVAVVVVSFLVRSSNVIDSIAVLPLKNLTGDAEQDYFVDGVTDELIGELGQISGLKRVISRTSVMQYRDTDKSLSDIARELKVDAVLEGTVYEAGDSVRIRFQLIDVLPKELNLGGSTYKRAKSDVLMMLSDITQSVADIIQVGLTAEEEIRLANAHQIDPEAYEAYLRGLSHWYKLTPADLEASLQYFESALKIDPDYGLAHTGIALVWIGRKQMGLAAPAETTPKIREAVFKALDLDSTLAEAHYALALFKTWSEWDWQGGEKAFQRAIELKPNYPDARVYYSNLLCYLKRAEEALEQGKMALEQDPRNSLVMGIYGLTLGMLGELDEAILQARNALRTSPHDPPSHSILWESYHIQGLFEKALVEAKAFFAGLGLEMISEMMNQEYEKNGYKEAMHLTAETLVSISKETYISPYFISFCYAFSGEKKQTLDWLENGYEIKEPSMPYLGGEGVITNLLHNDSHFKDVLRKMNLPVED